MKTVKASKNYTRYSRSVIAADTGSVCMSVKTTCHTY